MSICLLCKDEDSDDPMVTVGKKGLATLIKYAQQRNNRELEEELTRNETLTVHIACRRDFTNPKRKVNCPMESPKKKRLRSVSCLISLKRANPSLYLPSFNQPRFLSIVHVSVYSFMFNVRQIIKDLLTNS